MSCPLYFSDLPRTMKRHEYKFYSWWLRKAWRDNKEQYEKAFMDMMLYGTGSFEIKRPDTTS